MKVEKLVVGVIGLGMGRAHLEGAIKYGAEIGLICDTNPAKLKEWGEKNNIPEEKWTTEWHDIVNNKEINAVIIETRREDFYVQFFDKHLQKIKNHFVRRKTFQRAYAFTIPILYHISKKIAIGFCKKNQKNLFF